MEEAAAILSEFESLGDNCEFGFVQRRAGIEPGGLLRWTVSPPEALVQAMTSRFEGIYRFENLVPFSAKMVEDLLTGIKFHTNMTSTDGAFDLDDARRLDVHQVEYEKIKYLREKLLALIESGTKTLIYKRNAGVDDVVVTRLSTAISEIGPSRLLYVKADPDKAGTVDFVSDSLAIGYVTRFAAYATANDLDNESWMEMLQNYNVA